MVPDSCFVQEMGCSTDSELSSYETVVSGSLHEGAAYHYVMSLWLACRRLHRRGQGKSSDVL